MTSSVDSSKGVLILSPPRCGSSCLSACVSFQGFSHGKSPTTVSDTYNEKGYFENANVLKFNGRVLKAIGSNVHDSRRLVAAQYREMMFYAAPLSALLADEFGGDTETDPFVIKDPRLVPLFPLYSEVLPEAKVICLNRDADASARSMERMNETIRRRGVSFDSVWKIYAEQLDEIAESSQVMRVRFEELLDKPQVVLADLCDFLGVPFSDVGCTKAVRFIDKKLVRFGDGV